MSTKASAQVSSVIKRSVTDIQINEDKSSHKLNIICKFWVRKDTYSENKKVTLLEA